MYSQTFTIRWADVDALMHMRHSAYNDYATQTRLLFMNENGFGMNWFKEHNVYPILLREETTFLKEINCNENITIDVRLLKMTADGSKWSMMNRFYKEKKVLVAKLIVDGAWIDFTPRKLIAPPLSIIQLFSKLEKCEEFELSRSN